MTAIERATEFITGLIQAQQHLRIAYGREAAILTLASIFNALEQAAYERGVTDGQALAALNQPSKGE